MQMFPYLAMHVGPWKQCPPSIITNPSLFSSVFFCHFSSRKALFSIFGSVHWTLKEYPSIMTIIPTFTILLVFFIQHSYTFHIWKCVLDPEHNAQHGHQPSPIFFPIFSDFFSLFYCYFSFSIAILS